MTHMLRSVANDAIVGLTELFDYYLYSVRITLLNFHYPFLFNIDYSLFVNPLLKSDLF